MFTSTRYHDKLVLADEYIHQIDRLFGDDYDAAESTPINEKKQVIEMTFPSNKNLDIGYVAKIVVSVSMNALQLSNQELLGFLDTSTLNEMNLNTRPSFDFLRYNICEIAYAASLVLMTRIFCL